MPRPRRYSDSALKEAVQQCQSFRQVLARLGLKEAGGNYRSVKERSQLIGLSLVHLKGQSWRRGSTVPVAAARPLLEILTQGSSYRSSLLGKRLVREQFKPHRCEGCLLEAWQGRPIPLELDHANGDRTDNRLLNLRLLCPNCHAQTSTYRGKNIGRLRTLDRA